MKTLAFAASALLQAILGLCLTVNTAHATCDVYGFSSDGMKFYAGAILAIKQSAASVGLPDSFCSAQLIAEKNSGPPDMCPRNGTDPDNSINFSSNGTNPINTG